MKNKFNLYLKDFLIPLFTAIIVVLVNQLFIFGNKNIEARIEYQSNRLKEQLPMLNKILWFCLENSRLANTYERVYFKHEIIGVDTVIVSEQLIDSSYSPLPLFLTDSLLRNKVLQDIIFLEESSEILDHKHRVFLLIALGNFRREILPNYYSINKISKSIFGKQNYRDKLYDSIEKLYAYTYYVVYKEDFDGKIPSLKNINSTKIKDTYQNIIKK